MTDAENATLSRPDSGIATEQPPTARKRYGRRCPSTQSVPEDSRLGRHEGRERGGSTNTAEAEKRAREEHRERELRDSPAHSVWTSDSAFWRSCAVQLCWRQLSAACWSFEFVHRHCVFVLRGRALADSRVAGRGYNAQVTAVRGCSLADAVEDALRDVLRVHPGEGGEEEGEGGDERELHVGCLDWRMGGWADGRVVDGSG